MTTTPQPQVDIEELAELEDAATRAAAMFPFRMGIVASAVLALITEVRALRAVKLRVHELASARMDTVVDMFEIERITGDD